MTTPAPTRLTATRLTATALTTAAGGPHTFTALGGQCLTLMGPSGVGKSLLLRALADLDPHGGDVTLALPDKPLQTQSTTPPELWRQQVTYVPAAAGWWADTVGEHFACWSDLHGDCDTLGLTPECAAWPVARLSSGERQRLALLRAVALQAPVLLLDEPTANLDAETSLAVEQWLMARKRAGVALVWVTHDAGQAARVGDVHLRVGHDGVHPDPALTTPGGAA